MSRARDRADGVLHNRTHEDTEGGRESIVTFKGEQSGGEISTLAQIQASHDGTSDDQKADLIFKTNDGSDNAAPTEAMRITSQQRLGLGIDDPSDDFEIKPSADEKGITLKTPDSIRPYLNFDANRSGANQQVMRLQGKWNGNTITRFETSTGDDTSNKDNGYFTFQTATSSSDLNTRVRIDEHGIKFGSDTAEANGLNDYEEGTFSAGVKDAVSGNAATLSGSTGRYTKIGRIVNISFAIQISSLSGMTGTNGVNITGLPYTVNSQSHGGGEPHAQILSFINNLASGNYSGSIITRPNNNTNTCELKYSAPNPQTSQGGESLLINNIGSNSYLCGSATYETT